jgi:hypothetical protein
VKLLKLGSILINEKIARAFIEKTVPPLKNDEVLVALLSARRKYDPALSASQEILAREIIRDNDVEKIIQELRKLSTVGFYLDRGKPISQTAFAMYIDLNPKSILKAFALFNREINNLLYEGIITKNADYQTLKHIDLKLFSAIHRGNARTRPFWCLDIDKKDFTLLKELVAILGKQNVPWVSETCNGFHLIVERNETTGELLFKEGLPLTIKSVVTINKEPTTPVPGTLQGGVLVKQVKL